MAIEKWRPAKAGDSGLVRYRLATQHYWNYDYTNYLNFDSNGYVWIGGSHWQYCEVLEAYLSDEGVDALVSDIQQWRHDQMKPESRLKNVGEVIREHFKKVGE